MSLIRKAYCPCLPAIRSRNGNCRAFWALRVNTARYLRGSSRILEGPKDRLQVEGKGGAEGGGGTKVVGGWYIYMVVQASDSQETRAPPTPVPKRNEHNAQPAQPLPSNSRVFSDCASLARCPAHLAALAGWSP